jgi:hypothetical protein
MPKLYYCDTNYNTNPPTDINPLILQLHHHKSDNILALCARETMIKRIEKIYENPFNFDCEANIISLGWWDLKDEAVLGVIFECNAVIIIGKKRIDKKYHKLLYTVENLLCK